MITPRVVRFTLYGEPAPWARARRTRAGGFFNTAAHKAAQTNVTLIANAAIPDGPRPFFPKGEPVSVGITFYFKSSKAHYQGTAHASKPDIDNLAKLVLDGLNNSGVWHDDSQVQSLSVWKEYGRLGEDPSTIVVIAPHRCVAK